MLLFPRKVKITPNQFRIRIIYSVIFQTQENSAKIISGRCRSSFWASFWHYKILQRNNIITLVFEVMLKKIDAFSFFSFFSTKQPKKNLFRILATKPNYHC